MSSTRTRETRHITLARTLHARLYVNCEGRIFVVGGKIEHDKLAAALARQERCPTAAESPSPGDLGVPICDGELSQELLHDINQSLSRWRKELETEWRQRPAMHRGSARLARQQKEVEALTARLTSVRQWQVEMFRGGEPAGAPYFLDSHAEMRLQAILRETHQVHPLAPLNDWTARVVYWIAGRCAARRFLAAFNALRETYPETARGGHARDWNLLVASLAALAATDGSAAAIPRRCLRGGADQEKFGPLLATVKRLSEQIGQPGYDALLVAIDELPESQDESQYGSLRLSLRKANSIDDALWACEQHLLPWMGECFLSVSTTRHLHDAFAKRGCPLNIHCLCVLLGRIDQNEDLIPVHAWLKWLGSISPRAYTPRLQRAVQSAFRKMYLPSLRQEGWFEQLVPCLAAPRRGAASDDAAPLLDRIATYQQLAGKKATLPKSLRKLLECQDNRQREREHLRARHADGGLDAAAWSRLQYLEQAAVSTPDAAKIRRTAEEAFLLLGIEAMSAVSRRLAEAKCRSHLGELVALLPPDQLGDFARWIEKMTEPERDRLRTVIDVRSCHGREYKRHLAENQDWISKAVVHGLDLGPWFDAESHVETIGGRTMEITLVSDLHNIFLMGEYFHTCLSPGGCNEMSVLSNAYDANKQVLFMFIIDDEGRKQVVARQIVAVSIDFKLLGYCCYMSWRYVDKARHPEVLDAMASYCGRLAARCGMELSDLGSLEPIGDHFWYDDGAQDWPAIAHAVREEFAGKMEALALCQG